MCAIVTSHLTLQFAPLMGVMVELIGAEVDVSTEGLLLLLRSV